MISEARNIDCMEYMKTISDKFFDLAIVDPPYGIGGKNAKKNRLNSGGGKLKNNILNNSNCAWDSAVPDAEYFRELFRISKNQIIWGGNYFDLPPTRCIVCWDKIEPWENFSQVEIAWTSFDKPAKLFKHGNHGMHSKKIHPTQKPVELYEYLIDRFALPGNKIFDSHMGSGSSRIAAYKMGYDFYGCEINKDYFEAQEKRFERATQQQSLFV